MYSNLFSTNRKLLFIVLRKCIVSIFLIFINNTQPINDVTSISYWADSIQNVGYRFCKFHEYSNKRRIKRWIYAEERAKDWYYCFLRKSFLVTSAYYNWIVFGRFIYVQCGNLFTRGRYDRKAISKVTFEMGFVAETRLFPLQHRCTFVYCLVGKFPISVCSAKATAFSRSRCFVSICHIYKEILYNFYLFFNISQSLPIGRSSLMMQSADANFVV